MRPNESTDKGNEASTSRESAESKLVITGKNVLLCISVCYT